MEMQNLNEITLFYGWWQLTVCLFAFLALIAIWYHLGKKQNDFGQVLLACSILCWSVSGGMEILYAKNILGNTHGEFYIQGSRSVLSLLNSLFILLALPYFKYLPAFLESTIKSKYWKIIVGLPFLFSLLPTLTKLFSLSEHALISELDVYYSILTLLLLAWVLWESFNKRRLSLLAYLSIFCVAIIFIAQVYKLTDNSMEELLFSAIFKSSLIMIFFALALSWVKDMAETLKAHSSALRLHVFQRKNEKGKSVFLLNLNGVFDEQKDIAISKSQHELLVKFAQKRKDSEDGWLEIKPKNALNSNKDYDIRDYNEIKRLLQAILDAQIGKGAWTKEQHELPLKNLLLERSTDRERKIRLALQPENIEISTIA